MSPLLPALVTALVGLQDPPPSGSTTNADPLLAVLALPMQPPLETGVRVVVKDPDGKPVTGAVVVHVAAELDDARMPEAERLFPGDEANQYGFRAAAGQAWQTDERGGVRVPKASGRLVACKDGRVAAKALRIREGEAVPGVELRLQTPWSFVVAVVDAQGAAIAGLPVGVMAGPDGAAFPQRRTGDDGRTMFRVIGGRPPATALVRLLVACTPPVDAPMPGKDGEQVRIQLPPHGSLRATFVGDLLPGSMPSWTLRAGARSIPPSETDGRTVLFRVVGTDFQGELGVWADGSYVSTKIDGIAAGTRKELRLERPAEQRRVVLRVLDAEGNVARSRSVRSSYRYRGSTSSSTHRTNAEGWLEVVLHGGVATDGKLLLDLGGKEFDDPVVANTEIQLSKDDKGRIDRGEVRFTAATVALAGVAVDPAGKPIADVRLQVRHDRWYQARTDAAGRFVFAIPGNKPASLEVQLQSEGWYFRDPTSRSRTFDGGADVRLVLQPAGRMRFAAEGMPKNLNTDLDVQLEPASGEGPAVELPDFPFGGKEVLLPPGHWHLVFREDGREIHRLDDVRVDPGIEVHDPRFMNFDWRTFAVLVTIHVEDKDGKPFDACTVWHHYGNHGSGRSLENGSLRWLLPQAGGRMKVEPDDRNVPAIELGIVTTDQFVRLGSGPRLRIELSAAPSLPPGATLVALVGKDRERAPFDAEGKATIWLPQPGEHQVRLAVRRDDTDHDLPMELPPCDVPPGGQTLNVTLTEQMAKQIAANAGK